MSQLWQDLRYGLRPLWKSRGFTAMAVGTLALGIGANAAIFSFINGLLLQPLPFKDPSRLVTVLDSKRSQGVDWVFVPPERYEEWARRKTVFDEIAAAQNCYYKLNEDGTPALHQGGCVTSNFFAMFGVQPFLGRLFTADEDKPNGNLVAVLSYACWTNRFGGDRGAIGKTIGAPRMTRWSARARVSRYECRLGNHSPTAAAI